MRLILIGPPGVGKGTQAKLLEERTGAKHLSSGMIFRSEIEAETDLGRLAKSYIDHGQLVPNGVTIQRMAKRLRSDEVRKQGFILDGFPRTVRQATELMEILDEMGVKVDRVVSLEVDDDVVVERLAGRINCNKCGEVYNDVSKPPKRPGLCDKCNSQLIIREDDKPDAIRERLRGFRAETAPVIHFYDQRRELRRVDAHMSPDEVYAEITRD